MKLPEITAPTYTITLPVSKQKVSFRPFTVKEEKNMLLVQEHADEEAFLVASKELVSACTFGKLALNKVPMADFEYLFLNIRSKSVGEEVEGNATCGNCGKKGSYTMNLNNITVKNEPVDSTIQVTPQITLVMSYPTVSTAIASYELGDNDVSIAASCVQMMTVNEEVYDTNSLTTKEIAEFIEAFPAYAYRKLADFLETAPKLVYDDTYKCPHCETTQKVHLEGLENFFE